jgi:protoglobin
MEMPTNQTNQIRRVAADIPGYDYGARCSARSPITVEDFELLKQSAGFTSEDVTWLRAAGEALTKHTEELVKTWRDIIASHPHLARYALSLDGRKDQSYAERSGLRFQQWILDTCFREYDQDWLNYQHEIALRHTSLKKNQTDNTHSAPTIHLRHIIAFMAVVTDPSILKPFLRRTYRNEEEIERMHRAWTRSLWLQIALWTAPYTNTSEAPNEW